MTEQTVVANRAEIVLGIDLGTSFSTAAAWVDGKMHLITDSRGEACIPSVVYFPTQGAPVIGAYAAKMRLSEPTQSIGGIKRVLGRPYDSGEVRILDAHSAVKIEKAPNGSPVLCTRAGTHTPVEIASHIYRQLRELAEARFRSSCKKAVITIPATANAQTEAATIMAARAAGLDVIRTVSEPVAGAIAQQLDQFQGERRLLVYDFGGGTFDVTVLHQQNQEFRVLALGGDSCLGGDDLDLELAQLVSSFIFHSHKVDLSKDVVTWDRLVRESEVVKRGLSSVMAAPMRIKELFSAQGRRRDLDLTVTRADAEARWEPLIQRSIQLTATTMMQAGLRPEDLDAILLVGGSTYVPMVRSKVAKTFGKPGVHQSDPQTAVAEGAALMAARALSLAA
ncbi:MAG: Hsp70 family protein [Deltaproteobacteria bacterium]|nr:Hsp70 family protein [Deltaproteobacteria bacterium]